MNNVYNTVDILRKDAEGEALQKFTGRLGDEDFVGNVLRLAHLAPYQVPNALSPGRVPEKWRSWPVPLGSITR